MVELLFSQCCDYAGTKDRMGCPIFCDSRILTSGSDQSIVAEHIIHVLAVAADWSCFVLEAALLIKGNRKRERRGNVLRSLPANYKIIKTQKAPPHLRPKN